MFCNTGKGRYLSASFESEAGVLVFTRSPGPLLQAQRNSGGGGGFEVLECTPTDVLIPSLTSSVLSN